MASESDKLANEHWAWLAPLLEKFYKDAFVHGFKHGIDYATKEIEQDEEKK